MPKGLIAPILILFAANPFTMAQEVPADQLAALSGDGEPTLQSQDWIAAAGSPIWVNLEYLLWWLKPASIPIPLVTTSTDPSDLGILGTPTTHVVYGGHDQGFGPSSGGKIAVGGWLNASRTLGIEGSGFLLEEKGTLVSIRGDADGNPLIAVPFAVDSSESSAIPSFPGTFRGGVTIRNYAHLWGAEVNGFVNVARGSRWEAQLLGGFRYLDLKETWCLDLDTTLTFAPGLASTNLYDQFETNNHFYGGQLGGRIIWQGERLALDLTGMLALGVNEQTVTVSGSGVVVAEILPGGSLVTPFGLFSEPSNLGRQHRNEFAAVPQVELKMRYAVTGRIQATLGYNFVYVSDVVRPGDQIDRVVASSPPGRPTPLFNRTDFFAHGLNFGVECRY